MISFQEMTASLAAAKDASMDAGVAAVSSKLDDISRSKEYNTALKAFLPTCFGKSLNWHSSSQRLATVWWRTANVTPRTGGREPWAAVFCLN